LGLVRPTVLNRFLCIIGICTKIELHFTVYVQSRVAAKKRMQPHILHFHHNVVICTCAARRRLFFENLQSGIGAWGGRWGQGEWTLASGQWLEPEEVGGSQRGQIQSNPVKLV
jgi:hypothetical protein